MYQRFLLSGARKARNDLGVARCAWAPHNCSLPAAWAARSFPSIRTRNRSERTCLGKKKLGLAATQREPSVESPPAGTIMWTCGWWGVGEPQGWNNGVEQ